MKKLLPLFLILFVFAGFVNAQSGPASTANWYGFILPPSPAANKYISFTMQDLGSVSIVSDEHPHVATATFADGLIYIITEEHLKCFDPANPTNIQDHGVIENDGFNLAIDMDGNAYLISTWGNFCSLDLSNAHMTVINPIDLPIKMSFDMLTGELFGVYYGNLYRIDTNTGAYTNMGSLHDGSTGYDPTCLFMTYDSTPTTFTVGDLNYSVNDDHVSVTVTGHVNGYDAAGPLVIPESVSYEGRDYMVTTIGTVAFMYCFYLTSLTIPNTVTTIKEGAFAYCSGFTGDLVIPNSVVTIEPSAFQICYGFNGTLTLGTSLTTIGDYAFNDCPGLTGTLYIPSNVTSVGGNSFGYCAFEGIVVDPENPNYDSREDCNAIITTSTNELITGCKNTVIPNTVTAIGENSFKGITGMTSINIPNSVVSIGDNAFAFCFDLTGDLTIPNSVKKIGASAFFQCEKLDGTLTIGESVDYIGDWAFRKCSRISAAVSLAPTPATLGTELGGMVFAEFGMPVLTVPCECAMAYENSAWYDPYGMVGFYEFDEDCTEISEVTPVVPTVYPNPTQGMIKIEAEGIQNVSIFNTFGQKVFESAVDGDAFEYDFSNQSAGMYLIKVETTKGVETKQVMLVK